MSEVEQVDNVITDQPTETPVIEVKEEHKEEHHENQIPESRFKEVYKDWRNEQRRNEEQAEIIKALMAERQKEAPPVHESRAPDPSEYPGGKFDPDYIEALTEYRVNEALQKHRMTEQQRIEQEKLATRRQEIDAKERAFVKLNPDYFDSVAALSSILPANRGMLSAVMESDDPPGVAYYLSKNIEEAEKISKLSATKAAIAIGKIEDKVKDKPEPKPKTPPPTHIKPSGNAPPNDLAEATSMEEYVRLRRAQRG